VGGVADMAVDATVGGGFVGTATVTVVVGDTAADGVGVGVVAQAAMTTAAAMSMMM
jgi:hypothetical protein